jgi:cation diffusion facilitator family transporter
MEARVTFRAESPPQRLNLWVVLISFLASVLLMAGKFYAAWFTGSAAILSDALESIINVVASGFAFFSIWLAGQSPDPSHPYGHGKVEYFSAGFEGALIILAACGIAYQATPHLWRPRPLPNLDLGLFVIGGITLANLVLGLALVKVGRRTGSVAVAADGKHILTDVYTSAGVILGLVLARFTGWYWLDGAMALAVGVNILVTGARLVRESSAALMDASDPALLEEIAAILHEHRKPLWIDVHRLRARRAGDRVLLDFHLILPRDLSLKEAHREVKELERIFDARYNRRADVLIHLDPCERPACPVCGFDPCEHRQEPTKEQKLWRGETVTPDEEPGER